MKVLNVRFVNVVTTDSLFKPLGTNGVLSRSLENGIKPGKRCGKVFIYRFEKLKCMQFSIESIPRVYGKLACWKNNLSRYALFHLQYAHQVEIKIQFFSKTLVSISIISTLVQYVYASIRLSVSVD
jgi:hypothetical protein